MELRVKVTPRAKSFAFELLPDGSLKVYAKQKPEMGRVNAEIVREMSSILGCNVRIVKGTKSRNKVIKVEGDEKEILRKLGEKKSA